METHARFVLIGIFTLAVTVAVFMFVYWLNTAGGLGQRDTYAIRFENPVSGLLAGSPVLFNGIRVGEVTDLRLNPENPREVSVSAAVEPSTPIRADTRVEIDFQGLTGTPVILLTGGDPAALPLTRSDSSPPLLTAAPEAGQTMTQSARVVLNRFDKILTENSEPLKSMVANLNTFSEALARNSERVDGIAAGLERMTGGSGRTKAPIYDLNAPNTFPELSKEPIGQLSIPEPTALLMLNSDAILERNANGEARKIENAQWSDHLPVLLQAKLVEAFENAGYQNSVTRQIDGVEIDNKLIIDIRHFHIVTAPDLAAEIELSVRIVPEVGRIVQSKIFKTRVPVAAKDPSAAAAALAKGFEKIASEMVVWTAGVLATAEPTNQTNRATP